MKEKELRFGNYIMAISDKVIETVIKLEKNKINACNDTYFIPIPLTEEWLIKFGFKYDEQDEAYIKGILHIEDRDTDRYLNKGTKDKLKGYFGIWFNPHNCYVNNCFIIDIKYVHQLQNLYFALTGEELTIK